MKQETSCFALIKVWDDGSFDLIAAYKKKSDAENRRDMIARIARLSKLIVIEVPFVVSLK